MEKILIAINSCKQYEDDGFSQHLRDTWLRDAKTYGFDYKFFVGRGAQENEDVVAVDAGDSYLELGSKSVEKFKYAVRQNYSFVFGADCDTAMCMERLATCGFDAFDYYGDFYHQNPRQPWPHGSYGKFCQAGPGFFMSRKAMQYFIQDYKEGLSDNLMGDICRSHSDVKIGDGGWERFSTPLFVDDHGPRRSNAIITAHLSTIQPNSDHDFWHKGRVHERMYQEWKSL